MSGHPLSEKIPYMCLATYLAAILTRFCIKGNLNSPLLVDMNSYPNEGISPRLLVALPFLPAVLVIVCCLIPSVQQEYGLLDLVYTSWQSKMACMDLLVYSLPLDTRDYNAISLQSMSLLSVIFLEIPVKLYLRWHILYLASTMCLNVHRTSVCTVASCMSWILLGFAWSMLAVKCTSTMGRLVWSSKSPNLEKQLANWLVS